MTDVPHDRRSRRGSTGVAWRTVSAVLFLLMALTASQLLLVRHEATSLQGQVRATADSLQMARAYGPLVLEVFDLQQELDLRNTGVIPRLSRPMVPPPDAPPGLRPIPLFIPVPIGAGEGERIRRILSGSRPSPQRAGVRVLLPADFRYARAVSTLRQLGFRVIDSPEGEIDTATVNAIAFGDSVPLADVRLAAFALMDAGLTVTRVRRAMEGSTEPKTLTISNVRWAAKWPPLTPAQIDQLTIP